MKLQVIHRTEYSYAGSVIESFNEVRLQPASADGQVCQSYVLKIFPPSHLSHYFDFYQNYVQFFEITEPHATLSVESNSKVITSPPLLAADKATVPMSCLPECLQLNECYDFLQASPFIQLGPEVWRLAVDASAGVEDVWQVAQAIMRFTHGNFAYVPNSTHVGTVMTEVIAQGRGVCQDFAHVMLGMCRSLKIPARYVSGYLYNGPDGQLLGSQASHAWCEVFLPGIGWRALDPTNNQLADERYVKVAVGRDYADIVPVKGSYKGPREKSMKVTVQVTHLQD
jgi:transglutaminase-like putative cysteine protease